MYLLEAPIRCCRCCSGVTGSARYEIVIKIPQAPVVLANELINEP
jgi:hypothetical protein